MKVLMVEPIKVEVEVEVGIMEQVMVVVADQVL
jgi:hypothetical protein